MKFLRYVPVPALVGAGLFLFWLLSRWDGAQTARLAELDRQQATAEHQTLHASQTRRATQAQSEATDRENARLRAQVAAGQASIARLRRLADSAGSALTPVLASLPDSVSHPVRRLLALKDSVIVTQDSVIHGQEAVIRNLWEDRGRWASQDSLDAALAHQWEGQANLWRKEAKRSCLPVVGCVNRSVLFLAGVGVGLVGSRLLP